MTSVKRAMAGKPAPQGRRPNARTWAEKFASARPFEIKRAPIDIAGVRKGERMLVPSPHIVAEFIAAMPRGTTMDVKTQRARLARKFGAEVTCPIATSFHLRIVAEAALEAVRAGAAVGDIVPFWRVLDEHAPTTGRLRGGAAFVKRLRRSEALG